MAFSASASRTSERAVDSALGRASRTASPPPHPHATLILDKSSARHDLNINSGTGDLNLSKVEGAMQIKAFEGNAKLDLIGGTISATFGSGNVDVKINQRSWRGRQAVFQLASGTLNVQFPNNMNAEIDASVLRNGKIENSLLSLKPRDRSKFSDTLMLARAGTGGALLSFTVGDGTLKMSNW